MKFKPIFCRRDLLDYLQQWYHKFKRKCRYYCARYRDGNYSNRYAARYKRQWFDESREEIQNQGLLKLFKKM